MPESHDAMPVEETFAEAKQLQGELSGYNAIANDPNASEEEKRIARQAAVRLRAILEVKTNALYESASPFERLLSLREQYEQQRNLLERAGILERLSSGEMVIRTIDVNGKPIESPFPSLREVSARLKAANIREQREDRKGFIEKKIDQDFKRLLIAPQGMSLLALVALYERILKEKAAHNQLFYTKKNPFDPDEEAVPIPPDQFDADNPMYIDNEFKGPTGRGADIEGTIVYHPVRFNKDTHEGKTKEARLIENPHNAWSIALVERSMNIPRAGMGVTIGGREQLDTSGGQIREYIESGESIPSLDEYLASLRGEKNSNIRYKGERGQTPEEALWEAIALALETGQVMHDYSGHGSVNYLLGAYFPKFGRVPFLNWGRDGWRAFLFWGDPGKRNDDCGVRPVAGA